MTEKVNVEFEIINKAKFLAELQTWTDFENNTVGYRADDQVEKREALRAFTDQMELVLRRHDDKTTWKERPIEALVEFMMLEIREFELSYKFLEVSEARKELVDIANYAMIVHDRMKTLNQRLNAKHPEQMV